MSSTLLRRLVAPCLLLLPYNVWLILLILFVKVGGLYHNMRAPLDFLRDNFQITDNVMWCSHLTGVKKLVTVLSTCIFPDKTTYPIDETMVSPPV